MLPSLLTESQAQLLRDERQLLAEVSQGLVALQTSREDLAILQQAALQLDELFLLVVVGEFNAGKSALVNALLGEKILPEGVTPTTTQVTLVKWGEQVTQRTAGPDLVVCTFPLAILQQINIVDTPGTNAVIREHEQLTNEFVPRSDLVLFVTSSDRPMTESERQFLERIRAWGKKVVIVLNKADILANEAEANEVREFVLRYSEQVLGLKPEFFFVSARLAQQAAAEPDPARQAELRKASRIQSLIEYITTTLDDQERLQIKLSSPLGVAEHVLDAAQTGTQAQADALSEDRQTATAVETVITGYEHDLQGELVPRLAEIDQVLARFQERGLDFFDQTLRLTNVVGLARGDKVRAAFEKQVLADVPQQIESLVARLIDWLVDKDLRQWRNIMSYLQRRQALHREQLVGEGVAPLDTRRRALLDSVGRTAQTIVDTYNRDKEAHDLAASAEAAVAQVALMEVGAVGLGTLVMTAIASSTLDFTGLLAAGTLAIVGLFVIPYKRRQAKAGFKSKTQALREGLVQSLTTQFKGESEDAVTRMREGVAPYTRFVRTEGERVQQALADLERMALRVESFQSEVDALSARDRRLT